MAAGTWYLVEQCGQTVHGTACEEKFHSRAPKRETMCEQEKIGSICPGAAGENLARLSLLSCNAMCRDFMRDLPLDVGLEAFFCDMAQGAPAAAVTSVEFHRSIHLASASQRSARCSGFVNVIRN
jgi:hypothetical protein